MRRLVMIAALAAVGSSGGAGSARAQARIPSEPRPLLALAHSDLRFGTVLPGIPARVNARDLGHAALFEVRGPFGAAVRIELLLPSALDGLGDALLPISFGPGDGLAGFTRDSPSSLSFNPANPLIATLGPNGSLWVRLGGTVLPGRPQLGGPYSGTIVITVFDLSS